MHKIAKSFLLEMDIADAFKKACKEDKMIMSGVIEELLKDYLQRREEKRKEEKKRG